MSFRLAVSRLLNLCVQFLLSLVWGSMLHKLFARMLYFPSIVRMKLREGPGRRWYDRIDETVILGALPFRSITKELVEQENVRAVISYNEAYELKLFTNSKEEWTEHGVEHQWFSTVDFQPPSLPNIWAGVRMIESYKARGLSVYVHCKAGKGRSAVVTACYLLKTNGFSPTEALQFVRERRPQISTNGRQKETIYRFHEDLKTKQD